MVFFNIEIYIIEGFRMETNGCKVKWFLFKFNFLKRWRKLTQQRINVCDSSAKISEVNNENKCGEEQIQYEKRLNEIFEHIGIHKIT